MEEQLLAKCKSLNEKLINQSIKIKKGKNKMGMKGRTDLNSFMSLVVQSGRSSEDHSSIC